MFRRKSRGVQKIAEKFDRLQSDLDALRKDAKQLANGFGEAADDAMTAAGDVYAAAGKWTNENVGTMRGSVRDQPLTACIVALGAGALLGAIFFRR